MFILELIHKMFPDVISLSPAQIAKVLNCHVRSVNRGLADGTLPLPVFSPTPDRKRVLVTDLADFLEARTLQNVKRRGRPVGSRNKPKAPSSGAPAPCSSKKSSPSIPVEQKIYSSGDSHVLR